MLPVGLVLVLLYEKVVWLHAHQIDFIICTPETPEHTGWSNTSQCCSIGPPIQAEGVDVFRPAPQEIHYHVDINKHASLTWNKEGSKGLMVLRVKHARTRFPTNSLYTSVESILLHSMPNVCRSRIRLSLIPLSGTTAQTDKRRL